MQITAAELTTLDIEPDGQRVRMNLLAGDGRAVAIVWPLNCLMQLLMTLPSTIQRALYRKHGDSSLRLVHKAAEFRVELGEPSAAGERQLIVTLATGDGFAVSFVMSESEFEALSNLGGDGLSVSELASKAQGRLS
jgi:hypothetical protein